MAKRSRSPCPKGSRRIGSRCVKVIKSYKPPYTPRIKKSPKKKSKKSYKPPYTPRIKKSPVKNREYYLAKLKRYVQKLKQKMNQPRVNYDYMYITAKNRDIRYIKDMIERVKNSLNN